MTPSLAPMAASTAPVQPHTAAPAPWTVPVAPVSAPLAFDSQQPAQPSLRAAVAFRHAASAGLRDTQGHGSCPPNSLNRQQLRQVQDKDKRQAKAVNYAPYS